MKISSIVFVFLGGGRGGATPGKILMGLRIYYCDQVVSTGGQSVQIVPAGSLGVKRATVRYLPLNAKIHKL